LLVKEEKAPNAAGAREIGFGDARTVVDRINSGAVDAVIALGHDVLQEGLLGSEEPLAGLDTVIVLDTHASEIQRVAHVIVPVRHAAEKLGTFVNAARRVQRVVPAVESAWETYADGEVLAKLGAALGLDGFDGSYDAHQVARDLAAANPGFAGIDLDSVGDAGCPLADSAASGAKR
jgi:formate dehydrogenase major subunit